MQNIAMQVLNIKSLPMLKEERFQYILRKLTQEQKVNLSHLSRELNVSSDTVRRDLKELTGKGLLQAVRGGAVLHSPTPHHFQDRVGYQAEQKKAIAAKAAAMIKGDEVVVLDSGTTALAIASLLPSDLRITVVTNSFPVASVLESHPHIEVLFAGGRLYKSAFTTTGHDTIRFFRNIRADIYFMGICSIHHAIGVTTINYEEAEVKKTIVEVSKHVVALTTPERIGTAEAFFICPIEMVDSIITDDESAATAKELLAGTSVTIL